MLSAFRCKKGRKEMHDKKGLFYSPKHPRDGKLGFLFKRLPFFPDIKIPTKIWNLMPQLVLMLAFVHLALCFTNQPSYRLGYMFVDEFVNILLSHQVQCFICLFIFYVIVYARSTYGRHKKRNDFINKRTCNYKMPLKWGFFYFFRII